MGLKFNVHSVVSAGVFAVVLVVLSVIGKIVGCSIGAKASNFTNKESLASGVAMVPRAEVALIVASFGFKHGVIGSDLVSSIIVMVIVTSFLSPPLLWRILGGMKRCVPA